VKYVAWQMPLVHPKPCKFPVHAARRAAVLVKCGQEVTTRVRNTDFNNHSYYTSIKQVCENCAELEQIRVQYNATHVQLVILMHRADGSLVYTSITEESHTSIAMRSQDTM
jgi:hypothetical protein